MLRNLFKKKEIYKDPTEPYSYSDDLVFVWSPDSEGWMCKLTALGDDAKIYIAPKENADIPQESSCETALAAINNISKLNEMAIDYLLSEAGEFVKDAYKHNIRKTSLIPTGIEIFEHDESPGKFTLTYDPIFDRGANWKVDFKLNSPYSWGFDD